MADTLETLFNGTLQSSDFDSSGEATVFTNSSSQRRTIKYVQSLEGDATYPASSKLMVGDHELGTLSGNLEGTAIIGTGETLKVKATNLPVVDKDVAFTWWGTSNAYHSYVLPHRNNVAQTTIGTLLSNQDNGSSGWNGRHTGSTRTWWYSNVGGTASAQGNFVKIYSDVNSSHGIYIGNSSGTSIYSLTTSYKPYVFDQKQYVYTFSTTHLERIDATAASPSLTNLKALPKTMSLSTYPQIFMVGNDYIVFAGAYTNNDSGPYTYQISTDTLTEWDANQTPNQVLGAGSYNVYGVALSSGKYILFRTYSATVLQQGEWTPTHTGTFSFSGTNISFDSSMQMYTTSNAHGTYGDRFYYMNNSYYLCYYDFVTGENGYVNGTNTMDYYSSNPLQFGITEFTPLTATQSARTYEGIPSIKLRITGIKSE